MKVMVHSFVLWDPEIFTFQNKTFSFYKDFNQNTEELSSNEQDFLEEIFDQIILDIFNASVANW